MLPKSIATCDSLCSILGRCIRQVLQLLYLSYMCVQGVEALDAVLQGSSVLVSADSVPAPSNLNLLRSYQKPSDHSELGWAVLLDINPLTTCRGTRTQLIWWEHNCENINWRHAAIRSCALPQPLGLQLRQPPHPNDQVQCGFQYLHHFPFPRLGPETPRKSVIDCPQACDHCSATLCIYDPSGTRNSVRQDRQEGGVGDG